MIETSIIQALSDATDSIAATLGLPVAHPNVTYNTEGVPAYLEVVHLPNTNGNIAWQTPIEHRGIWQVNYVSTLQRGAIAASVVTAQIALAFAKGTRLAAGAGVVQIDEKPSCLSVIEDGHKGTFPVSIPYRCFET